jgi:nucleoside phosphorylase
MGPGPARAAIARLLVAMSPTPSLVLTCGFAGGLHPALAPATVLFEMPPAREQEKEQEQEQEQEREQEQEQEQEQEGEREREWVRLEGALRDVGARPATFLCAARVATTRAEKDQLRRQSGADAVEMESGVIQQLCRDRSIPCATVRVISDSAQEDLPLDFNDMISAEGTLRFGALLGSILRRPAAIPGLLRLQRRTAKAAKVLGSCLEELLRRVG